MTIKLGNRQYSCHKVMYDVHTLRFCVRYQCEMSDTYNSTTGINRGQFTCGQSIYNIGT